MTQPLTPSPQITQLNHDRPKDDYFHVLPNLAVRNHPDVWQAVIDLLAQRGVPREEALTRIRFAYTGNPNGQLPPGVE